MGFLPKILGGAFCLLFFLCLPRSAFAVTVASQTQSYSDQLVTHRVLQELGNNLSGIAGSFTFRVSTSKANLSQFDYTIQNTRIFDKDAADNFSIVACAPADYNPADPLGGLTFDISSAPTGFEDVTIDFSCHNYSFIPGHRYLIIFGSANYNDFSGLMLLATAAYGPEGSGGSVDQFSGGGLRYSTGNKFDSANNGGSCSGIVYKWNDPTLKPNSGCNIFSSSKDDLYFVLKNTAPEPTPTPTPAPLKNPVIFIPGIGGSEFKASQEIFWENPDGHGGTYKHGYGANEKIWVNQDEAAKLGDDDYFDVLRLKADGVTPEADLSLTGNLTFFGYGDIDSFFQDLGYVKGTNFFTFTYDWRKDVRTTKDSLDALVEEAKTKSGQSKVNIVAHSMGGLIARYYIADSEKAGKVNKLISMGVPHLGAPKALKTLMYGTVLEKNVFGIIPVGIPSSEVKDIYQNLPGGFQLLPSKDFYKFYDNSNSDLPYPFRDDRDIDNDKTTGVLNFSQIKTLLTNLAHNMTVFAFGEQFHNDLEQKLNQNNGVTLYHIVGSNQPTVGQIHETWWITWPINLIPKTDEIFINGDETIPLYSASLKNDSIDLSGGATIYYVDQKHSDLVSANGTAMQTVKSILETVDLPVEVKTQKIDLEGQQISINDGKLDLYDDAGNHTGLNSKGEIETNIPGTFYSTSGKSLHAFIKKGTDKVNVQISSANTTTTDIKIREYQADKITKTTFYNDTQITPASKAELTIEESLITSSIQPTAEVSGGPALDQTPPKTKIETSGTNPVTVTLTGSDADSGILKIEYSLDNGQTVKTYTGPFTISNTGKTILQVKSIDKLGNEEVPQETVIEITSSSSSSSGSSSSSSSDSSSSDSTQSTSEESLRNTSEVTETGSSEVDKTSSSQDVLGSSTQNPASATENRGIDLITSSMMIITLFMTQGGMILLSSLGSALTFFKPTPK